MILYGGLSMQEHSVPRPQRLNRAVVFALFLVGGLMVFLLGNNWNSLFPTNDSALYKWSLPALFLVVGAALRQSERFQHYWGLALALFIAAFANALNWQLGNWLAHLLPRASSVGQELAVDKISQCVPVVIAIVLLTRLAGNDLGSLFIKKGNLRWGLRFGLISFGIFAIIFAAIAVLQSSAPPSEGMTATGVPLAVIAAAVPWILVFVFANSLMEELWFRWVFLGRLRPILGATTSVVVTALVFGIPHVGATYISPIEMAIFPSVVFALGLVNGFVMLKTNSIWGSVLFHAGYDLLIIIPVFVSLQ
jgi:membrane protease YdiL (CAAX protease family)